MRTVLGLDRAPSFSDTRNMHRQDLAKEQQEAAATLGCTTRLVPCWFPKDLFPQPGKAVRATSLAISPVHKIYRKILTPGVGARLEAHFQGPPGCGFRECSVSEFRRLGGYAAEVRQPAAREVVLMSPIMNPRRSPHDYHPYDDDNDSVALSTKPHWSPKPRFGRRMNVNRYGMHKQHGDAHVAAGALGGRFGGCSFGKVPRALRVEWMVLALLTLW